MIEVFIGRLRKKLTWGRSRKPSPPCAGAVIDLTCRALTKPAPSDSVKQSAFEHNPLAGRLRGSACAFPALPFPSVFVCFSPQRFYCHRCWPLAPTCSTTPCCAANKRRSAIYCAGKFTSCWAPPSPKKGLKLPDNLPESRFSTVNSGLIGWIIDSNDKIYWMSKSGDLVEKAELPPFNQPFVAGKGVLRELHSGRRGVLRPHLRHPVGN